jgi:hypothetical protein
MFNSLEEILSFADNIAQRKCDNQDSKVFFELVDDGDIVLVHKQPNNEEKQKCLYVTLKGVPKELYSMPDILREEESKKVPHDFKPELKLEERVKAWIRFHAKPLQRMWDEITPLHLLERLNLLDYDLQLQAWVMDPIDICSPDGPDCNKKVCFIDSRITSVDDAKYLVGKIVTDYELNGNRLEELIFESQLMSKN